jgi:hypothetical protein
MTKYRIINTEVREEMTQRTKERWKTPIWFKVALGMFGAICLSLAIVGSLVHH